MTTAETNDIGLMALALICTAAGVFVPSVFGLLHGEGSGGDAELVLRHENEKRLA